MFGKSRLALVVAEFFGAATLTAIVLAVSKSGVGFPYFIAIGLALAAGALLLTLSSVRNVTFNPALTVALWTARLVGTLDALLAIAAQMLGAVAAWRVYEYLTDAPLRSLAAADFNVRVFTAEAVGTFLLGLAVAAAVYYRYESGRVAATYGAGLFLGVTLASVAANGLVNPAVALGVQSWNWEYVLGPLAGAVLAVNLYAMLFAPAGSFRLAELVSGRPAARSTAARAKRPVAKKPAARRRTTKTARKR